MWLIMAIVAVLGGIAVGAAVYPCLRRAKPRLSPAGRFGGMLCAVLGLVGGMIGLLWFFRIPTPFSVEVDGPPHYHRNDPSRSVYFGNGCFWHTQYDFVVVEEDATGAFGGRNHSAVTSLVGYAGGRYQSRGGAACYHGLPSTDYSRLGHAEAVSIELDAGNSSLAQVAALAKVFFEHGFETRPDGRRGRLDPQDTGAEYRNVIGLPKGKANLDWWPLIEAQNTYGMPLLDGAGGTKGDTEDDHVVYVYDSDKFPFFRGEAYHQFHTNDVIRRPVPLVYTETLKNVQLDEGRLDNDAGCTTWFGFEVMLLFIFVLSAVYAVSSVFLLLMIAKMPCCCPRREGQASQQPGSDLA